MDLFAMLNMLVTSKVYYRIFDLSFQQSSHVYAKYRPSIDVAEVTRNLKLILTELEASNILILHQVHGNLVYDADQIQDFSIEPIADAVITTRSNLALAIQTADCVPVLLYCEHGKVIGAMHAGWKGAKADIIANTVKAMQQKGAKKLKAIIGPSIQQYSYEVDQKYYQDFIGQTILHEQFFVSSHREGYYMFDLPAFVAMKLQDANVEIEHKIYEDTYSNPEKYPSYRRSYHQASKYQHNILSTIVIR
jgi:YfiH family protein